MESDIGWVPFLLQALDYQLIEIAEGRHFKKRPPGLYPIEDLEGRLTGLIREEKVKVLCTNAARLYRIALD